LILLNNKFYKFVKINIFLYLKSVKNPQGSALNDVPEFRKINQSIFVIVYLLEDVLNVDVQIKVLHDVQ